MDERMIARFRNMESNPQIMGCEVSSKAGQIADFFESLKAVTIGTYSTDNFSNYIAGQVVGCQLYEHEYDDISIATTLDLHNITLTSYGVELVEDFILYHKDACGMNWDKRIEFYYDNMKAC